MSQEKEFKIKKQAFLISKKIMRKDEEGNLYDLSDWVRRNEYNLFPTIHPDFLDALSRIYDMDAMPPISRTRRSLEPETEARF